MNIEDAIRAKLLSLPALSALVGERIRPEPDPDDAYPFILYEQADRVRLETLDGYIDTDQFSMSLEVYAATKASAKSVMKAFCVPTDNGGILGFSGELTDGEDTVEVQDITVEDESSEWIPPVDGANDGVHLYSLTLVISQSGGE